MNVHKTTVVNQLSIGSCLLVCVCLLLLITTMNACSKDSNENVRDRILENQASSDWPMFYDTASQRLAKIMPTFQNISTINLSQLLQNSFDQEVLMDAAFYSAASPKHWVLLSDLLNNEGFLNRLDSPSVLPTSYRNLRLAGVLRLMISNGDDNAKLLIAQLANSEVFNQSVIRRQLLISSFGELRPMPDMAIQYLNQLCTNESSLRNDVIESLLKNQGPASMDLLIEKLLDETIDRSYKQAWLRQLVLPKRNETELLVALDKVIGMKGISPEQFSELAKDIVEVLFDYQPQLWYGVDGESVYKTPSTDAYTNEAKGVIIKIANQALAMKDIPNSFKILIRRHLAELMQE